MFRPALLATSIVTCFVLQATLAAQSPAGTKQPRAKRPHQVVTLPVAPLVGGADSCTTPDVIAGTGSFAFDTTTSSTGAQGQSEALCNAFGTTGIDFDVWFVWMAPFTGFADLTTCNGTGGNDTKIAAYAGTACPAAGSALACNDDSCNFESHVVFPVTSGSSYVLQIGEYPGSTGGMTGVFFLTQGVPPPADDDCATPTVISGSGTFPFDNSNTTTGVQGQNNNCTGVIDNDEWFAWTASQGGTATVTTCNGISPSAPDTDTTIAIYSGAGCPAGPEIACNDDSCGLESTVSFPTVCGQTYTMQLGRYPGASATFGTFAITESGTPCGPPAVPYCFGDGTGTPCPCGNNGAAGNGCASSVSAGGAHLSTSGLSLLANDTLVLSGTAMPNSSCLYFQGTTQIGVAFGDGLRCAGGAVTRLATKTNAGGASQYPAAGDLPIHVKGGVAAPGTRTYQVWYRNAASFCTPATFNLTNGVLITWQ
jgi:hypothetical protein